MRITKEREEELRHLIACETCFTSDPKEIFVELFEEIDALRAELIHKNKKPDYVSTADLDVRDYHGIGR